MMESRVEMRQMGFTLVELLLAASLTVILLGLVVFAFRGFLVRAAGSREVRELDERAGLLQANLQADFETLGRHFVRHELTGSGTELLTFAGNPDYMSGPGYLVRHTNNQETPLLAQRMLATGAGQLSFVMEPGPQLRGEILLATNGATNNATRGFVVQGSDWTIQEDGQNLVHSNSSNQWQAGDRFLMQVTLPPGGAERLNYYLQRGEQSVLLHQSARPVTYPLVPVVQRLSLGGRITELALNGSSLRDSAPDAGNIALLPLEVQTNTRFTTPILTLEEGFVFLRAEETADLLHTITDFGASSGQPLMVTRPERGHIAVGDYLLVMDFLAHRSVVVQVASGPDADYIVRIEPINRPDNAAWGRLYSPDADWAGHIFPVGSSVVKLAPPVEWGWLRTGNEALEVRRRVAQEDWVPVDLSVRDIAFREQVETSGINYLLVGELYAEAVELANQREAAATRSFNFTFTPAPLNTLNVPY